MEKVTGNGISSAPEIFQRNMNEIIEGLEGVEVVADDFLRISKWKNKEEGIIDNDNKMLKFLQSWKENSLHLNPGKIQLRKDIWHIIIIRSLKVDPAKIESIQKMQTPKDIHGVKRIIGMCQYLHKFLPKWSNKSIKKTDRKKFKHGTGLIIKKRS